MLRDGGARGALNLPDDSLTDVDPRGLIAAKACAITFD
jgi:hypothetical protein